MADTEINVAIAEVAKLRAALLLYHEAWNGNERDWHAAMCVASKEAEIVLWNKERPAE